MDSRVTVRTRCTFARNGGREATALIALATAALVLATASAAFAIIATDRVSVGVGGVWGDANSYGGLSSTDGRFVVFQSAATNLVPSDTNGRFDIFLLDRRSDATARMSISSSGGQADQDCEIPGISADGRYVVFDSAATNLVSGDTNGHSDVFLRDRKTKKTGRISVSSKSAQANGDSSVPAISANGRYVVFSSKATNLVSGDTNGHEDIFLRDLKTKKTSRISVSSKGHQANNDSGSCAVSSDGRYVAFVSRASNLVSGDTNNALDVFVRDRTKKTTTRVSVTSKGVQGPSPSTQPAISADGRYVAFLSGSVLTSLNTGFFDNTYVRDRKAKTTTLMSAGLGGVAGDGECSSPSISADGRYVGFASSSTNLVATDTNHDRDVFVHDRKAKSTRMVSLATGGTQANMDSDWPGPVSLRTISPNGHYAFFDSAASNLVSGNNNGWTNVYAAQLQRFKSAITPHPGKSSVTYTRSGGVANYTLWAAVTGDWGRPIANTTVVLLSSKNGKKWSTLATLTSNGSGRVYEPFHSTKPSTRYYRWQVPSAAEWFSATSHKQKVVVK